MGQFEQAPADTALLLALHHPVYSADLRHGSNLTLGDRLDDAFARGAPDAVLTGHVTTTSATSATTAAARSPMSSEAPAAITTCTMCRSTGCRLAHPERAGVELVSHLDIEHGYLHIEASPARPEFEYRRASGGDPFDPFAVDL